MNYPYAAEIGGAYGVEIGNGGMFAPNMGYGPYATQTVFGDADPNQAAMVLAQSGIDPSAIVQDAQRRGMDPRMALFSMASYCGAPPAHLSNHFDNRRLKSVAVGQQCGPIEMDSWLPFSGPYVVPANGSLTLFATAQLPCKATKLVIAANEADSVLVSDFKCGIQPLFAGGGYLAGLLFSEVAKTPLLNGVSAAIGQQFSVTLTDTSGQAQTVHPGITVVAILGGWPQIYGGPSGT